MMTDAWERDITDPATADPPVTAPAAADVRVTVPPRMAAPPAVRAVERPAGAGAPDGTHEPSGGLSDDEAAIRADERAVVASVIREACAITGETVTEWQRGYEDCAHRVVAILDAFMAARSTREDTDRG